MKKKHRIIRNWIIGAVAVVILIVILFGTGLLKVDNHQLPPQDNQSMNNGSYVYFNINESVISLSDRNFHVIHNNEKVFIPKYQSYIYSLFIVNSSSINHNIICIEHVGGRVEVIGWFRVGVAVPPSYIPASPFSTFACYYIDKSSGNNQEFFGNLVISNVFDNNFIRGNRYIENNSIIKLTLWDR